MGVINKSGLNRLLPYPDNVLPFDGLCFNEWPNTYAKLIASQCYKLCDDHNLIVILLNKKVIMCSNCYTISKPDGEPYLIGDQWHSMSAEPRPTKCNFCQRTILIRSMSVDCQDCIKRFLFLQENPFLKAAITE